MAKPHDYLSRCGLAWNNFTSPQPAWRAIALARGLTRRGAEWMATAAAARTGTIGNFWVDLTRATVYILLPLSIVFTLVLASQGVLQNLSDYKELTTLEGGRQVLAMGPVASQEAINSWAPRRRLLQRERAHLSKAPMR